MIVRLSASELKELVSTIENNILNGNAGQELKIDIDGNATVKFIVGKRVVVEKKL